MSDNRAELIRGQYFSFSNQLVLNSVAILQHRPWTLRTVAKLQERDDFIRESWVKAMEARLVRDELIKCQRHEGVNSLENCRWLSEKYAQMLVENRVRYYLLYNTRVDRDL